MKRQKILYLGLDPGRYPREGELTHLPIIRTVPHPFAGNVRTAFARLAYYTHVVLTSRTAAQLYGEYAALAEQSVQGKVYLSVGSATTECLKEQGVEVAYTALEQTGEGVVDLLEGLDLTSAHLFFPRSAQARSVITDYCTQNQILMTSIPLYETEPNPIELPDLAAFDQIVFTSPSTVHAFFARVHSLPHHVQCLPIGPVTAQALIESLDNRVLAADNI